MDIGQPKCLLGTDDHQRRGPCISNHRRPVHYGCGYKIMFYGVVGTGVDQMRETLTPVLKKIAVVTGGGHTNISHIDRSKDVSTGSGRRTLNG